MKKKSLLDLIKMKETGEKISWITAYDAPFASFAEAAGIEMILVGDSLGMVVLGYESTIPVTMDDCIRHCQAVRRGAPNTFVVGDMPFGSYQTCPEDAVFNAVRFLKEGGVDAIKLEGGKRVAPQIRAICEAGIVVCGHIGLTPQSSGVLGGHKAQGRTIESARAVIEDALAVQEAGAFSVVLECIPAPVSALITSKLDIPTIGIGGGTECDGQILVYQDMLGTFTDYVPKFVKHFANIGEEMVNAFKAYDEEVKAKTFPDDEHSFQMKNEEALKRLY